MKKIFTLLLFVLLASCYNKKTFSVPENHAALSDKNGKVWINETPLSGFVFRLGNHRDTIYKAYYKNGKKYGSERYWYSSHQLKQEHLYKADRLHGIQRAWYANGNPKMICTYKENVLNGPYIEWSEKGLLIRERHYQDGIKGTSREWDATGKLLVVSDQ